MKILWLFIVLQTALAQPGFGRSYLRNSRLCHQWACLNSKLDLSDSLPTLDELENVLRRLLPQGPWQGVVDDVLDNCYHNRSRRFTNTCPGQAVMHCVVDQLIANCPEESLRKEDACAPVSSISGLKHMFTQGRYDNIERNLLVERRPSWFVRNYFNTKCCNLPELFNVTTLSECGFTSMVLYYDHNPGEQSKGVLPSQWRQVPTTPAVKDSLNIVSFKDFKDANIETTTDPLDCCDISGFIEPSWRQECNFEVDFEGPSRLVIKQDNLPITTAAPVTTTTKSSVIRNDFMIVPNSCEETTCVFNKLNILSPTDSVDTDAFIRLLDNFTHTHPTWTRAKGKVVKTCLTKPVTEYSAPCEINKVLACTLDVLTENCPYANKTSKCNWRTPVKEAFCQISSSKYRPKNRRDICSMPDFVDPSILKECSLLSIGKSEHVPTVVKPKTFRLFTSKSKCLDLTPSTSCLMEKMDILNKYGFMDYFKMKDRIRHLTSEIEWSAFQKVYLSSFSDGPLYREHCNSAKKLLNVIDAVLLTCPESKRKNTIQCARIFDQVNNTPISGKNVTKEHQQRVLNHFLHIFYPPAITAKKYIKRHGQINKAPIYNYGILNGKNAPVVTTIDVKPKIVNPPLVLLPVYMRTPANLTLLRPFNEDGVMRGAFPLNEAQVPSISKPSPIIIPSSNSAPSPNYKPSTPTTISDRLRMSQLFRRLGSISDPHADLVMRNPFLWHNQIAHGQISTPTISEPISTVSVSTSQPVFTTPASSSKAVFITHSPAKNEDKYVMIKPE